MQKRGCRKQDHRRQQQQQVRLPWHEYRNMLDAQAVATTLSTGAGLERCMVWARQRVQHDEEAITRLNNGHSATVSSHAELSLPISSSQYKLNACE